MIANPYPLKPPPGVQRNGTRYQSKGYWYDANLIRFYKGTVRPVGGWESIPLQLTQAANASYATDSTTEASNTDLESHTPDSGFGGWEESHASTTPPVGVYIEAGFDIMALETAQDTWVRNTTNMPNRLFSFLARVGVGSLDGGTNQRIGVVIFQPDNTLVSSKTNLNGEGLAVFAKDDGTTMHLHAEERDSTGTVVQSIDYGVITITSAAWLEIRLTVDADGVVTVDTNENGAGFVTKGTITVSSNILTSHHNRVGFRMFGGSAQTNSTWVWVDGSGGNAITFATQAGTVNAYPAGVTRKLMGWKNNAQTTTYLAAGTNSNLYALFGGEVFDITPAGITAGAVNSTIASGVYGSGKYGRGPYGEGDSTEATLLECASWQFAKYGQYLVGVLKGDGKLYWWDLVGSNPAVAVTNAPTGNLGVVVTPESFLVALGGVGFGAASSDPALVRWMDQGAAPNESGYNTWDQTVSGTTALEFSLDAPIMLGLSAVQETLIFTEDGLWAMRYIGGSLQYSFTKIGFNCGPISRHSVAILGSTVVWMSRKGFWIYDGFVQPLPGALDDYVFSNINDTQRHKCWAETRADFHEIIFHYPSALSYEPDRRVTYNVEEKHWCQGTISRTAGIDQHVHQYPIAAAYDGTTYTSLYDHERGNNHDGQTPYVESGPIELGDGQRWLDLDELIPDEETIVSGVSKHTLGSLRAYLYTSDFPNETEVQHGPYTMANPTEILLCARAMRIRIEEVTAGEWRFGHLRFKGKPGSYR